MIFSRRKSRCISLVFGLGVLSGSTDLMAQASQPQAAVAYVLVESNPAGKEIYLDTEFVGKTPQLLQITPVDSHRIVVRAGDGSSWFARDYVRTFAAPEGDTLNIQAAFSRAYFLRSMPHDALVFLGDSLLGRTPLTLELDYAETPTLELRKEGYHPLTITIGPNSEQFRMFVLERDEEFWETQRRQLHERLAVKSSRRRMAKWGGVLSLVAGTSAILLKRKADDFYEKYRGTADPARMQRYISKTEDFDTYSGIAFGVFQLSFAFSVYQFLRSQ